MQTAKTGQPKTGGGALLKMHTLGMRNMQDLSDAQQLCTFLAAKLVLSCRAVIPFPSLTVVTFLLTWAASVCLTTQRPKYS